MIRPASARLLDRVTWTAVMRAAGWRCECTGECGRPHSATGERCGVVDETRAAGVLRAAPTNPAAGLTVAVTATADDMSAWCYLGATLRARREAATAAAAAQPDLFGGEVA
jgi:hypothetical protein